MTVNSVTNVNVVHHASTAHTMVSNVLWLNDESTILQRCVSFLLAAFVHGKDSDALTDNDASFLLQFYETIKASQ